MTEFDRNESGIVSETFEESFNDILCVGHIMYLEKSCWVWLSTADTEPSLTSIAVSMPSTYEIGGVISSQILDSAEGESSFGDSMAQRIAKRFKIQCFVSSNIRRELENILPLIEGKIVSMLALRF